MRVHPWLLCVVPLFSSGFASSGCDSPGSGSAKPSATPGGATTDVTADPAASGAGNAGDKVVKTDEQWRKELTPEQFRVLCEKGTEMAFSGAYWDSHEKATYV